MQATFQPTSCVELLAWQLWWQLPAPPTQVGECTAASVIVLLQQGRTGCQRLQSMISPAGHDGCVRTCGIGQWPASWRFHARQTGRRCLINSATAQAPTEDLHYLHLCVIAAYGHVSRMRLISNGGQEDLQHGSRLSRIHDLKPASLVGPCASNQQ